MAGNIWGIDFDASQQRDQMVLAPIPDPADDELVDFTLIFENGLA